MFHQKVGSELLRVLFFILAVFYSTGIFAQQRRLPPIDFDAFRESLSAVQSADGKLQKYVDMSMRAARFYPDSLMKIAGEVERLEGLNSTEKKGFTNFILAYAWLSVNQDSAIHYGEKALSNLKAAKAGREYIFTANLLGNEYNRKREYLKAESIFLNAISYSEMENREVPGVNILYGNLGSLYAMVGLHDKAIEMFKKFLGTENNPATRCNTISKLAVSLMEINEMGKAAARLSVCLDYPTLPPPIKATVHSNLGKIYNFMGDEDRSLRLIEEAARISYRNNIPNLKVSHLIGLGNKYLERNKIQKADSIRGLLEELPIQRLRPNFRIDEAIYFAEVSMARKDYQNAIDYVDIAIETASRHNMQHLLKDAYSTKSTAFEHLGKMEKAIDNLRLQRTLEQFQKDKAAERNLAMMKVRYQLLNKEQQLTAVTRELGTVKITTALVILFLLLGSLYVAYRVRMHFLFKEERTRNKIAGDLHDEVSATLSSISYFAEAITRNDPGQQNNKFVNLIMESAGEAKDKITDIIWAINTTQDTWKSLLSKCRRYAADLMEGKGISYHIDITEQVQGKPTLDVKQNIWLIFKEVLTNVARHSSADEVEIQVHQDQAKLVLKVADNGKGFDITEKANGIGLKNIYRRVDAINGSAILHSDPGEGTRWEISIPL